MRWLGLLLLGALLTPFSASGQGEAQALLSDGTEDTRYVVGSGQSAPTNDATPEADLVSLEAVEEDDAVVFTIKVVALDGSSVNPMSYFVRFAHGAVAYQVEVTASIDPTGSASFFAYLQLGHEDFGARILEELPLVVDRTAGTFSTDVPKARLVDERGSAPYTDRALSGIIVYAQSFPIFGFDATDPTSEEETMKVVDHMPDDPGQGVDLVIKLGDPQTGDAALGSADPTRTSNGEATTYAFNVTAFNEGTAEADFELSSEDVPAGWSVHFPIPFLRIPAGGSTHATVLVSAPFGHDHGDFESFRVVMTKEDDPSSRGTVTLGVRYTEVAQPAGHHDTLYLHQGQGASTPFDPVLPFVETYMNTLEEDPQEVSGPIPATTGCGGTLETRYYNWFGVLDPGLAMGLDFDLGRTGTFTGTIVAQRPMLGATLSGRVMHTEAGVLATFGPTPPEDLMRDGRLELDLDIEALPAADLVPYLQGAQLYFDITLASGPGQAGGLCPDAPTPPLLQPGAKMRLPLNEYHQVIEIPDGGLFAQGAHQRIAAPGSVLVFAPELGAGAGTVELELFGVNEEWADLVGPHEIRLGSDPIPLSVVVTLPPSAADSDRVDLILKATPSEGPPSFIRLVVDVDPAADVVSESAEAAAGNDAPGLSGAFALLSLFALVAAARRHDR